MIVERQFYYPKLGCREDLAELLKAEIQRFPGPHAIRLYWDLAGSSSPVAQEYEFEDFAEYVKWWQGFFAAPGTPAALEKYRELVDRPRTNELWFQAE